MLFKHSWWHQLITTSVALMMKDVNSTSDLPSAIMQVLMVLRCRFPLYNSKPSVGRRLQLRTVVMRNKCIIYLR